VKRGPSHETFQNILFATAFSDASGPAANYAITLAKLNGAHLNVRLVINEFDEHQRVMIPHEAFQVLQREVELQIVKQNWTTSAKTGQPG